MLRIIELLLISLGIITIIILMIGFYINRPKNPDNSTEKAKLPEISHTDFMMIQNLLINKAELKQLTGIKKIGAILYLEKNLLIQTGMVIFAVLLALQIVGINDMMLLIAGGIILFFSGLQWINYQQKQEIYKILRSLLIEVQKHNNMISNIHVLEQLKEVGHEVDLSQRDRVIQALTIVRQDLVRALKTERILRENPKFNPDEFNTDLTSLQALQLDEKSTEYTRMLDIALQISLSIQEKMRDLGKR